MNHISHSMSALLAAFLCIAGTTVLSASENEPSICFSDTTFACNDLVHVSLNENCEADISADEIVEGFSGDFDEFVIFGMDDHGDSVSIPISGDYLGEIIFISAIHLPSGNSCWGTVSIEDKWAPTLTCQNFTIQCFESPGVYPLPVATDNCDMDPTITMTGQTVDNSEPCNEVVITRTFFAVDESGNTSDPCTQVYTTVQPVLPSFPADRNWECHVYNGNNNVIKPAFSGRPDVALGDYCPYHVVHSDFKVNGCGETFTIVRTWTVINWCTGELITTGLNGEDNIQLIRVRDTTPPVIVRPSFTVTANIGGQHGDCRSTDFLLPAQVSDNCHNYTVRILTAAGEAEYIEDDNGAAGGFIPFPGLPLGESVVIYEATDECGNIDTVQVTIMVADQIAPVAVCDELTNVSLGATGEAEVFATTFDDGSHDDCCLDSFLVRRMMTGCVASDTLFDESVTICCADVGDTVTVVFRALDCFGNFNDCMVLIEVEEKLPPVLHDCPPNQNIDCEFYADSLELALTQGDSSVLFQFGQPDIEDNCQLVFLENSFTLDLDQCLTGNIVRRWRVTDPGENAIINCTQLINVSHISDWVVTFPADITVNCTDTLPPSGEPQIFFENCELVATSFEDQLFTIVPDVCFKIVRTWMVMNWCAVGDIVDDEIVETSEFDLDFDLNGDGIKDERTFQDGLNAANFDPTAFLFGAEPDGFIVFQQVIKVVDDVAPVVTCQPFIEICIGDTTCVATFELPRPDVMDCSTELTISATGDLGTGTGPFVDVEPGIYQMIYQVTDNCGNLGVCQTSVEVRDCKKPTPVCKNGLIIELEEDSVVILNPEILDAGSYDNCTDSLSLSFSADLGDTLLTINCASLGFQVVTIWLTDEAGNQDFCETFIFVTDNNGVCMGPPLISGTISNTNNVPVTDVKLGLSGDMMSEMWTESDGYYFFEVSAGGDYSVTASKNSFPLNGVTTFDLVLISKHILGIQTLDDPYRMIAADVNQSNSISTYDLVILQKLILQVITSLPNDRSWRFIDRDFIFPDPADPFATPFPELINCNDIASDQPDMNFVGIKLGDVNHSADPGL